MAINYHALEALVESGASAAAVLDAVRRMQREDDLAVIERRKRDAERKRLARAASAPSAGLRKTPPDISDATQSVVPQRIPEPHSLVSEEKMEGDEGKVCASLTYLVPPEFIEVGKRDSGIRAREEVSRAKGTALAADWAPDQTLIDYGTRLGFTLSDVQAMAEDMRLWALANKNRAVARKSDWPMTFKGWMRREAGKRFRGRAPPDHPQLPLLVTVNGGANGSYRQGRNKLTPTDVVNRLIDEYQRAEDGNGSNSQDIAGLG